MADPRFHKNLGAISLKDIAEKCGCIITNGDPSIMISDVASLDDATTDELSFLDNPKYKAKLKDCKASACIIHPDLAELAPEGMVCLTSKNPYKSYALAATLFYPIEVSGSSIHSTAVISKTATIGNNCVIEAYAIISNGVVIGDNCHIGNNVSITHALIGDNVRIHNGVRIGQEGFGFALDPAGYVPVPQLGRVIIGDNVNIGANTCIDRGAGPDTVIGNGSIIDNLVQIGHNVQIGKGCVIVSQVGISGSTKIGDYTVIGGQAGLAGHLNIGSQVQIGAQSGVSKDIANGEKVVGFPAKSAREYWGDMIKIKKLLSK